MDCNFASPKTQHTLSLAAQFDDLCRATKTILISHEPHSTHLLALLTKLQPLQSEVSKLRAENAALKANVTSLTNELEQEKRKLANIRHSLAREISSKRILQQQLESSRGKIREIRELIGQETIEKSPYRDRLQNLVVSNITLPAPLDETDESLSGVDYDAASEEELLDQTDTIVTSPATKYVPLSLPKLDEEDHGYFTNGQTPHKESVASNNFTVPKSISSSVTPANTKDSLCTNSGTTLKSATSATSIQSHVSLVDELEHKKHVFIDKPFSTLFGFLPSHNACGGCSNQLKRIGCHKRCVICNVACHSDCTELVPTPCLKRVLSSKKKSNQLVTIANYSPNTRPCIPPLIIHCVREIEKRGLKTPFLYVGHSNGICNGVNEAKLVRDYIEGKKILNFSSYDVGVLCNLVKEFFRLLKEPLISFIFWRDFASTLDMPDDERGPAFLELIAQLPGPNIDTFAYLMRHFHKVIQEPSNQVEVETIARVFAPFFIGYPSKEPNKQEIDQIKKTKIQVRLMCSLLKDIDDNSWENCLLTTVGTDGNKQWPIRASNARMSITSRRASHIRPCGIVQNGQIERATKGVF